MNKEKGGISKCLLLPVIYKCQERFRHQFYLWLPTRRLLSPAVVLAATGGLDGHEEDLVNAGMPGLSDLTSLLSTVEGPG